MSNVRITKPLLLGSALAVGLGTVSVASAENPFSASDVGSALMLADAAQGVDMKGNVVKLPNNFTFGGDNMATYADGKLATGAKDPAVCGTFDYKGWEASHLAPLYEDKGMKQ